MVRLGYSLRAFPESASLRTKRNNRGEWLALRLLQLDLFGVTSELPWLWGCRLDVLARAVRKVIGARLAVFALSGIPRVDLSRLYVVSRHQMIFVQRELCHEKPLVLPFGVGCFLLGFFFFFGGSRKP